MLQFVFNRYKFQRLTVEAALFASPATFKFIERLGFKQEGRKRAARLYKGHWFDVNIYGILRSEVLNGSAD
jgi:RimJ/RimL family protein N-acetyltransferase